MRILMQFFYIVFLLFFIQTSLALADDQSEKFISAIEAYKMKDDEFAFKLMSEEALSGYMPAQYNLAQFYDKGIGVEANKALAAKWFIEAAKQGNVAAQYNLGLIYNKGEGVVKDNKASITWFTKAAEQGDAYAQYNLGVIFQKGDLVEKDSKRAFNWFKKAAEKKVLDAQFNLASMYWTGTGTNRNPDQAQKIFEQLCLDGDDTSCEQFQVISYAKAKGINPIEKGVKHTDDNLTSDFLYVNSPVVNVRSRPDVKASAILHIYKDQKLRVLEEANDWVKIETEKKVTGWVSAALLVSRVVVKEVVIEEKVLSLKSEEVVKEDIQDKSEAQIEAKVKTKKPPVSSSVTILKSSNNRIKHLLQ